MLALGSAALRSRRDISVRCHPPEGSLSHSSIVLAGKVGMGDQHPPGMVSAGPTWPPRRVWGLVASFLIASLKEMELPQALGWENLCQQLSTLQWTDLCGENHQH